MTSSGHGQEDFRRGRADKTIGKYGEWKGVLEEKEVRECGPRHLSKKTIVGGKIGRRAKTQVE